MVILWLILECFGHFFFFYTFHPDFIQPFISRHVSRKEFILWFADPFSGSGIGRRVINCNRES